MCYDPAGRRPGAGLSQGMPDRVHPSSGPLERAPRARRGTGDKLHAAACADARLYGEDPGDGSRRRGRRVFLCSMSRRCTGARTGRHHPRSCQAHVVARLGAAAATWRPARRRLRRPPPWEGEGERGRGNRTGLRGVRQWAGSHRGEGTGRPQGGAGQADGIERAAGPSSRWCRPASSPSYDGKRSSKAPVLSRRTSPATCSLGAGWQAGVAAGRRAQTDGVPRWPGQQGPRRTARLPGGHGRAGPRPWPARRLPSTCWCIKVTSP